MQLHRRRRRVGRLLMLSWCTPRLHHGQAVRAIYRTKRQTIRRISGDPPSGLPVKSISGFAFVKISSLRLKRPKCHRFCPANDPRSAPCIARPRNRRRARRPARPLLPRTKPSSFASFPHNRSCSSVCPVRSSQSRSLRARRPAAVFLHLSTVAAGGPAPVPRRANRRGIPAN